MAVIGPGRRPVYDDAILELLTSEAPRALAVAEIADGVGCANLTARHALKRLKARGIIRLGGWLLPALRHGALYTVERPAPKPVRPPLALAPVPAPREDPRIGGLAAQVERLERAVAWLGRELGADDQAVRELVEKWEAKR